MVIKKVFKPKQILTVLLLTFLLFASVGCRSNDTFVLGISRAVTEADGFIYYINGTGSVNGLTDKFNVTTGALARMLPDGTNREIVVPMCMIIYQIIGNEIYMVTANEKGELEIGVCTLGGNDYRFITTMDKGIFQYMNGYLYFQKDDALVRTDKRGRGKVVITENKITSLSFTPNYIYYTYVNDDQEMGTYRADHNGKHPVKLNETETFILRSNNDKVYAVLRDDNKLYAIHTQTDKMTVAVHTAYDEYIFDFEKNLAYGAGSQEAKGIVSTDMFTGDKVKLSDDYATNLTLSGDWLYYANQSDNGLIYRVSLDGTKKELVSAVIPLNEAFVIIGSWLYYTSPYERSRVFRVNTQTLQRECIGIERTDPV